MFIQRKMFFSIITNNLKWEISTQTDNQKLEK